MDITDCRPAAASRDARIACVCLPDFALQLAVRRLPANFRMPVALVDRNDAHATVIAVQPQGRKHGIYPGLPYAKAAALCPQLQAAKLSPQLIEHAHLQVMRLLCRFSPAVEPAPGQTGAYYLDIKGMQRLEPDMLTWAQRIQQALLDECRLKAYIVIGFTRFAVQAIASVRRATLQLQSPQEETAAAQALPLASLGCPARDADKLEKLGIHTIGDLQQLAPAEIRARFSQQLFALAEASGHASGAVQGMQVPEPYFAHLDFDHACDSIESILPIIHRMCVPLLEKMKHHAEGASTIQLRLATDSGRYYHEKLCTAAPTVDTAVIMDLLSLKLYAASFEDQITAVSVRLLSAPLPDPQQEIFEDFAKVENALQAANRALIRVITEFGAQRVLRTQCLSSHLPENAFTLEYCDRIHTPASASPVYATVVRRIFDRPNRICAPHQGTVRNIFGPYTTGSFWWLSQPVWRREYFVETQNGAVQWIFYDQYRLNWYQCGFVQ